jgi:hypothetical protein
MSKNVICLTKERASNSYLNFTLVLMGNEMAGVCYNHIWTFSDATVILVLQPKTAICSIPLHQPENITTSFAPMLHRTPVKRHSSKKNRFLSIVCTTVGFLLHFGVIASFSCRQHQLILFFRVTVKTHLNHLKCNTLDKGFNGSV